MKAVRGDKTFFYLIPFHFTCARSVHVDQSITSQDQCIQMADSY